MDKEVLENHKKYLERIRFYRSKSYDLEKERNFILGRAMPVCGKILEIGTGKGHFTLALAKKGYNFTSIDISKSEQEIAALNLRYFGLEKKVSFRIEDAGSLSFPDRSFDVILSVNVFHHLKNPVKVLSEIIRLLRCPGKVVLSDFTDKGMEIINLCHTIEGRTHDYFKHRLNEAEDYLLRNGFGIKEHQSVTQRVLIATYL